MEAGRNYDLCLDSAAIGLDNCVEVIKRVIEFKIRGKVPAINNKVREERTMEALAYYDGKIGTPEELMVPSMTGYTSSATACMTRQSVPTARYI